MRHFPGTIALADLARVPRLTFQEFARQRHAQQEASPLTVYFKLLAIIARLEGLVRKELERVEGLSA